MPNLDWWINTGVIVAVSTLVTNTVTAGWQARLNRRKDDVGINGLHVDTSEKLIRQNNKLVDENHRLDRLNKEKDNQIDYVNATADRLQKENVKLRRENNKFRRRIAKLEETYDIDG